MYFSEKDSVGLTRICKWPMTQARLRTAVLERDTEREEKANICGVRQWRSQAFWYPR